MVPVIDVVSRRRWLAAVCAVLLAWSIVIQVLGAFAFDVGGWNNRLLAIELLPAGRDKPIVVTDLAAARGQIQSGCAAGAGDRL